MNRRALLVGVLATVGSGAVGDPCLAQHGRLPRPLLEGRLRAGELVSLRVRTLGRGDAGGRIDFDGEDQLPTSPSGHVLFAAPHDAPGRHTLRFSGGARTFPVTLASRPHPESRVRLPQLDVHTHSDALLAISRVRRVISRRAHFERGFAWPTDGAVTSEFAAVRPHGVHLGIDLVASSGTRVRSPADGVVVMHVETPVFGRTIVIDHGHGLTSSLLHLSRALAPEGASVQRGDVVALSGGTGRVTGPHLDWRVAWRDVDVDPRGVIALLPARA